MKLFTPPDYDGLGGNDRVIFVAGPMKGAPEWQAEAVELIHDADRSIAVASPRRIGEALDDKNFEKRDQVRWETHMLARAAFNGSLLFWYPEQDHEVAQEGSEFARPYGKTTNKELFKWWTRKTVHSEIALVLGVDPEQPDLDYEKEMSGWDMPDIPIVDSIEDVCGVAVDLAHDSRPIDGFKYWPPNSPLYVGR